MKRRRLAVAAGLALAGCAAGAVALEEARETNVTVLDTTSLWRFRIVWETAEVLLDSGRVDHVTYAYDRNWFRNNPTKVEVGAGDYKVLPAEVVRLPAATAPDWMKPDFDASSWIRCRGPMLDTSTDVNWKLVALRGGFEVSDPATAGDLSLSVVFRGGLVAYLNGEELTRAFMPTGAVDPTTAAEAYPVEVYLDDNGYLVWPHDDQQVYRDRLRKRIRRLDDFRIPASRLRKGRNVLALGIHRAPAPPLVSLRRIKRYPECDAGVNWCRAGLIDVTLRAASDAGVVPNVARVPGRGFLAWNQSILRRVYTSDYPDPFEPPRPVRLTGVRNGTFAGQVVVGHDEPLKGLRAEATDLTGPATIPAAAVRLAYALPDGERAQRDRGRPFDSLEEAPPAEVPVYEEGGGAIQPVWVTVRVPADAKPGAYAGALTIRADALSPITVPLHLQVIDWRLPDSKDFTVDMDIVESPESVAMAYEVPLWSEEHLRLLDRTFSLLAPLAPKSLYVTCVRRTHFGNEHAMVRWVRGEDGELQPEFTVAEKYLDAALKRLGRVRGVILYCWEPMESMGHAGGAGSAGRTNDRPILITVLDPATGRQREMKGPAWGTPESKAFWAKLRAGMRKVLEKRGLADAVLFGLIGDCRPTKQAMNDITGDDPTAKWAVHSHYYCDRWNDYEMGLCSALWGIDIRAEDPSVRRAYGWQSPFWLVYYPREMSLYTPLVEHRTKLENWLGAGSSYYKTRTARGLGRLGADFWVVLKDPSGNRRWSLAGRYPESYWGQLNLNYCVPHLLGPGKDGPVATVRSEAFRENIQEVEARVFIEKALLAEAAGARLGEDLARRCRQALDERIRICLHAEGEGMAWFVSSDWNARTETLFRLAAEVQARLAD